MAFVDGLIDSDQKVASSKEILNSRQESKNHTLFMTKMTKIDPYLWPYRLKNHTVWGRTYLYSPQSMYYMKKKLYDYIAQESIPVPGNLDRKLYQ